MEVTPQSLSKDGQEIRELMSQLVSLAEEVKEKMALQKTLLKNDAQSLQSGIDALSSRDDAKTVEEKKLLKSELADLENQLEQMKSKESKLKHQINDLELEVKDLTQQQQEKKQLTEVQYPRVRYAVSLYRDISKISWHRDCEPNEVKGFICSKSHPKAFRFDEQKQSGYFITNSLWEMGDSDTS